MSGNKVGPEDPPPAVEYKDPNPVNGNAAHMAENSSEKPAIENGKNGVHVVPYDKQTEKVNGVKGEEDGEKKDEEKKEAAKEVGVLSLFRYADCLDILCMMVGTLCACCHGAGLPSMLIIFGETIDLFVNNAQPIDNATQTILDTCNYTKFSTTQAEALDDPSLLEQVLTDCNQTSVYDTLYNSGLTGLVDQMGTYSLYFVYVGLAVLFVAYGQVAFWLIPSYRQAQKIRTKLFRHIMRQEIGWFDTNQVGELNTRLSDDVNKIQEGIGDKISNFFQWFSTFIAGIVIGFVYGWKLTLVILATSPLLVASGIFMTVLTTLNTKKELDAYAKAGAVAEQAFSSIRTVVAFGGEEKESKRYNVHLGDARSFGIKKSMIAGTGMGFVFFVIFLVYALAFWYGAKLVREDPHYTVGKMIIVFFCVLIGAFALGNAAPNLQNMAAARGAAWYIWALLDRESEIDSASEEGECPAEVIGNIMFNDISFNYPSRLDVQVLDGLNLEVTRGKTVALVGASGCGKSTTVQLIQRFYDPLGGSITVDGRDIRTLNIKWLRQHIGLVSQEPVLFDTTIMENIKFGRENVTDEEVKAAAQKANAHNFIMELPLKYETLVGERGAQLSGGQKQRIAIARALVRDPKILLLDEATSALDTESEATVQEALDKARQGRTTIVIAHRLSTIKNADLIYSLRDGKVFEKGTHGELMGKGEKGIYYQLVNNQKMMEDESGEIIEEKEIYKQLDEDATSGKVLQPDYSHVSPAHAAPGLKRGVSLSESKGDEKEADEADKDPNKEEDIPEASMFRVMKMNGPEWYFIAIGVFCAMINGGVQPAFAVIFAEILGVFTLPIEEQKEKALLYSTMFIVLAFVNLASQFGSSFMFGISGENLTVRIRDKAFQSVLKQEMAYFDNHNNSTGALCTRLATDASAVQGATGIRLGTVAMSLSAIGAGIIIGFIYSWKLTLAIMLAVPVLFIAGMIEMQILGGQIKGSQEALEAAGKVATQVLENIRTVASLTKEPYFYAEYQRLTVKPYKAGLFKAHLIGLAFSFSQAVTFWVMAGAFWFGAWLVQNDGLPFVDMMKVFAAIIFGAMGVGQAAAFAPDYDKAKVSANRMFYLFDHVPAIDSSDESGTKLDKVVGTVGFSDVHFRYPTRPTVPVLQGLEVTVKPKQVLAFVGSSGCGKSTSVSLIERFYDPEDGVVTLDGEDIKTLNLQWLRSQMGIVQQEPILFDLSIRENIAYGDNSREVSMDEIIKAARDANIHSFIESLPEGYETNVGNKGTQLSGGQKQRVAIARALVRDPKILLLDEATSALDTESEKVVQEALDRAQQGRTTVVIAHRLSTIQNADCITVIHAGKVSEAGTHSELMAKKGIYYKLNFAQQKKKL